MEKGHTCVMSLITDEALVSAARAMRPCVHASMRPCVHASMRPCMMRRAQQHGNTMQLEGTVLLDILSLSRGMYTITVPKHQNSNTKVVNT